MSLTIDLEKELLEELELIAKHKKKDINYIISKALDEYFEHLSDKRLVKIAEKRWADIESGKSIPISLEEFKKKYGIQSQD